jgi:hypothetical protein
MIFKSLDPLQLPFKRLIITHILGRQNIMKVILAAAGARPLDTTPARLSVLVVLFV